MTRRLVVLLVSAAALLPGGVRAQVPAGEPAPRPFLRKVIQLTDAQLADVEAGKVVTKQLPSSDKPEIAAFGIVRINGSVDTLLDRLKEVHTFRKVPQIVQIGRFSDPPKAEDLSGLDWPPADIDALKRCKPGACDVKMGTPAFERLKAIDWGAKDANQAVTRLMREQMVSYVQRYREGGTDAMGEILDRAKPKFASEEFRTLLKNSPYLVEYVPAFNDYVAAYPKGTLPNTIDLLFWTKDTFGLKPVVSMYHVSAHRPEASARDGLLVAIKTLYASHYFNAALEVMAAVPTPDKRGFYLIDLYRTRIDPPTGMLGGVLMGKVRSGIEQGVSMNLANAKTKVEMKP